MELQWLLSKTLMLIKMVIIWHLQYEVKYAGCMACMEVRMWVQSQRCPDHCSNALSAQSKYHSDTALICCIMNHWQCILVSTATWTTAEPGTAIGKYLFLGKKIAVKSLPTVWKWYTYRENIFSVFMETNIAYRCYSFSHATLFHL